MSKSNALKNTTDSIEGNKLHTCSTSIFVQLELMKQYKDSDLFSVRLWNDDVQDFDARWNQALFSACDMPSDVILEGVYKSELQDSVQLQTVLALYDQETVRHSGQPSYSRLKTSVGLHIDQTIRTRNFRVRNEVVERGAATKSQTGKKPFVERKVGECLPRISNGQCSTRDSCSLSHELASGNSGGAQRRKGHSSSPAPNSKAKTDSEGEKSSETSGNRDESSSVKRSTIPCRFKNYFHPSCGFRHPSLCASFHMSKLKVQDWMHIWQQVPFPTF